MSTAGISFGGLASGLDTKSIIAALVAVEERPIRVLESKKTSLNKQKSLFGDLKGLLDKLTEASKALKVTTDFLAMKAKSSNEDVLSVSASSSATPGTYSVKVESLAQAQVNSHSGSASRSATIGDDAVTLQIDTLDGPQFVSTNSAPTLDSLAAAINTQATGIRAEVIDTGNGGAERYQLVVRSLEMGAENAFTLSVDGGSPGDPFTAFVADLNTNRRTQAADAELTVNGAITVKRPTNTIGDLWPGITLDLKSAPAAPANEVTITVSTDAEETSKKVQAFVDAYNKVVDFFAEQNKLDSEGKASSPLFGDVTLRSIRSSLRSVIGGQVQGTGNEAYQLLSQVGITSDTQGKLTFNRSKFEEALASDENAVARVFTQETFGIAGRLESQIDLYTDGVDGLLKARTDGFDRLVKSTTDRIEQSERRLELYQKQLEQKYANLESLLSRLQSQGSGLTSLNSNR